MVNRQKAALFLELAVILLSSFVVVYGALKLSGLFARSPGGIIKALHEQVPQGALYLLLPAAMGRMFLAMGQREGRAVALPWFGVLLMAVGLVTSSFVRFEGSILLTEGQQFSGAADEYVEGSIATGKNPAFPRFGLTAKEVLPSLSRSGFTADRIVLKAMYQKEGAPSRDISITSKLPLVLDGIFFRIKQFGYSPRYRVTGNHGMVLDDSYVSLAVFPPGSEDSFRLQPIPHTFYVQYYPDGAEEKQDQTQKGHSATGPLLRLRVVRNLELLYRGSVRLHDQVLFESMALSFEDVRKWAEISVVRDHGVLLFFTGGIVLASALWINYRGSKSSTGSRSPRRGVQ